jgi:hypothetical protein
VGPPTGQRQSWVLYSSAAVGGQPVGLGSVVLTGQGAAAAAGLVQCLWQDDAGRMRAQVRTGAVRRECAGGCLGGACSC